MICGFTPNFFFMYTSNEWLCRMTIDFINLANVQVKTRNKKTHINPIYKIYGPLKTSKKLIVPLYIMQK